MRKATKKVASGSVVFPYEAVEAAALKRCSGCANKDDMIAFLRQEIARLTEALVKESEKASKLTEKLVLFSERASDHEHRLKMMQLSHMRPAPVDGIMSRDDLMKDDMSMAVDNFMDQIIKSV